MSMFPVLSRLFASRRTTASPRKGSFVPQLRTCEDRIVPSGLWYRQPPVADVYAVSQPVQPRTLQGGEKAVVTDRVDVRATQIVILDHLTLTPTSGTDLSNVASATLWQDTNNNGKIDAHDLRLASATPDLGRNRIDFTIPYLSTPFAGLGYHAHLLVATDHVTSLHGSAEGLKVSAIGGHDLWNRPVIPPRTHISGVTTSFPIKHITGALTVSQAVTPVRQQYLVGADPLPPVAARFTLVQSGETGLVKELRFVITGGQSIDRAEIWLPGGLTPIANATIAASGPGGVQNEFTALLPSSPITIGEGQQLDLLIKLRVKSDTDGGVRTPVTITLTKVVAVGANSQNILPVTLKGNLTSVTHDVVFAAAAKVEAANPDAPGTSVPTGVAIVGRDKLTTANVFNPKNALDKFTTLRRTYEIEADNIAFDPSALRFGNLADTTVTVAPLSVVQTAPGRYRVTVDFSLSAVNTTTGPNETMTTFVRMNVTNPKVSSALSSSLKVYALLDDTFAWSEGDVAGSAVHTGLRLPDNRILIGSYAS